MTAENYAQASYEALKGGMDAEVVLVRLKEILQKNGHSSLFKESARGLMARLVKDDAANVAELTVAKASDAKAFLTAQGIQHTKTIVDETIVGGFIVSGKGRELNASYKKSLLNIYRSLTA
jgi:F0F1-type ATP synthase delta subunit